MLLSSPLLCWNPDRMSYSSESTRLHSDSDAGCPLTAGNDKSHINSLAPWGRVLHQKATVAQLVKKFPASRATQEFSLPLSQEPVAVPCPESPASQRIPLESVFNGVHPLPSMSRSWKRSVSLRYAFVMCCMDLNQFVLNVKPAWMPLYLTALLI